MEVEVPKIQFSRPNESTVMVHRVLRWERQERRYGRKRQGPMVEKMPLNYFFNEIVWDIYTQLFPLDKDHKGHFLASIWCNGSWEASQPSMCLDHIIVHETHHFLHALPLNLLPHVSSNNVGHLELKNLSADLFFFGLRIESFGILGLVI
jgi:hypothetical protein